jgi:hypothetical protein
VQPEAILHGFPVTYRDKPVIPNRAYSYAVEAEQELTGDK